MENNIPSSEANETPTPTPQAETPKPVEMDGLIEREFAIYIATVYHDKQLSVMEVERLKLAFYAACAIMFKSIVYQCGAMSDLESSENLSSIHKQLADVARAQRAKHNKEKN